MQHHRNQVSLIPFGIDLKGINNLSIKRLWINGDCPPPESDLMRSMMKMEMLNLKNKILPQ